MAVGKFTKYPRAIYFVENQGRTESTVRGVGFVILKHRHTAPCGRLVPIYALKLHKETCWRCVPPSTTG